MWKKPFSWIEKKKEYFENNFAKEFKQVENARIYCISWKSIHNM